MPPRAKFTREEIVDAGLRIVRRRGIGGVTARELGAELGSSARPVFTVFQSMEEVQAEIVKAAREVYNRSVKRGLSRIWLSGVWGWSISGLHKGNLSFFGFCL